MRVWNVKGSLCECCTSSFYNYWTMVRINAMNKECRWQLPAERRGGRVAALHYVHTSSDCAYVALFPLTIILTQLVVCLFVFLHTILFFHPLILTTRGQRQSISVLYYWMEPGRLGLDVLIFASIDRASA